MKRPEPDALLIAQHVSEWPYLEENPDEPCRALYLYRMPRSHALLTEMTSHGYTPPGGVGKTEKNQYSRTLSTFGPKDMVKLQLVFVGDGEMSDDEGEWIGRDVFIDEWEDAREWLVRRAEDEQTGT